MRIAVVGGGIAGLATVYNLQQKAKSAGLDLECTLIESDTRVGGKIVTHTEGGFTVEGGPDSFMTQKPWAMELCRELDLGDRLVGTNKISKQVWILWKGKLHKLPDGVLLIVPTRLQPFVFSTLITPWGKLRMGMDLVIPARRDGADETVASFVRRRLGNEALEKIAEPLMGGVHVSDPERQSLLASFPRFADIERKHGSLVRGMLAGRGSHSANGKALSPFMTLRGGLVELVSALENRMTGTRTLLGRRALGVTRSEGGYRIAMDDGSQVEADGVVLATPARDAADLLAEMDGELAARLRAIRYVSTATVSLGYRRDTISHPVKGFGFVIPKGERRRITGCTWSSTKFEGRAPGDSVLLRCFLGGATDETPALAPEEEMVRTAREELKSLMGITAEPVLTKVYRWQAGHPQYDLGHLDRVAEIDRLCGSHPGLALAGSSYRGIGIPDCIHSGATAAESLLRQVVPV